MNAPAPYARRYVPGDARLIVPNAWQAVDARHVLARDHDDAAMAGNSYTIVRDGAPIACGGVIPLWPGVASAWALAGDLDFALARLILRQVRRAIAEIDGLRRVEATARADWPQAQNLLRHLGFRPELRLDAYDVEGGDHILFVWRPKSWQS